MEQIEYLEDRIKGIKFLLDSNKDKYTEIQIAILLEQIEIIKAVIEQQKNEFI